MGEGAAGRPISGRPLAAPLGGRSAVESRRHLLCFFASRRRHTRFDCDWSSDVCSSDLRATAARCASRPSTIPIRRTRRLSRPRFSGPAWSSARGPFLPSAWEADVERISLGAIDYTILTVYFAFVLGIGWALRRFVRSSEDFFLSGRSIPAWIAGLAFISANLGAQEVIGMAASGAKYGIMTSHFYWVGAMPAMVFVGLFMMPFYYGSRARSVPQYLKLRFDEKTRGLNAITFAIMTIFSSGISMYALAKLFELVLGWSFHGSIVLSAVIVLAYIFLGSLPSPTYT